MQSMKRGCAGCPRGSSRTRAPRPFTPHASLVPKACAQDGASGAQESSRRQLLIAPLVLSGLALMQSGSVQAEEAVLEAAPAPSTSGALVDFYDEILAYKFQYPVKTSSGVPLKMILAHEPEKYSSAAPLTADARQRIVCELLDLRNFVSVSMTVGPASGVLKSAEPQAWKPYDVALTVLVDRSTSRLTTGQRMSLNDVETASKDQRDGTEYFTFEHLSQGSPTITNTARKETYRHALAVTAVRPDNAGVPYLYTLNLSCRQEMWDDLQPLFQEAAASYRLVPPTSKYISPDTRSWQFW